MKSTNRSIGRHGFSRLRAGRPAVWAACRREITQRELRNDSGAIMRGVERGESFTITRNGTPIGRLIPLRRRTFVPREEVLAAFATAPVLDVERFRADTDALADQYPFDRDW